MEEANIALILSHPCNKSFCQNDTFRDCVVLDNHQDLATVRKSNIGSKQHRCVRSMISWLLPSFPDPSDPSSNTTLCLTPPTLSHQPYILFSVHSSHVVPPSKWERCYFLSNYCMCGTRLVGIIPIILSGGKIWAGSIQQHLCITKHFKRLSILPIDCFQRLYVWYTRGHRQNAQRLIHLHLFITV